ncbi:MAG TPA: type II toxin-antitoxin system VapC family toxin [Thermoanaerobaculia bacterium]|nr:type II toxin-antitoxin system VapC family toxin [Thermoanaerobaculia bacterium]
MRGAALLDTGPLVAFLNRRDRFHAWAVAQLDEIEPPLLTCEPVLSEACFLLRHDPAGPAAVLDLVHDDLLRVGLHVPDEIVALRRLVRKYAELPISLADACLIRMAELNAGSVLLTLDSDFKIYRMHGRQVVPTLMPTGI